MRLSEHQIQSIKATTEEYFGSDARVYVFGSRTDENRRGGDIDLYIEARLTDADETARARIRFISQLKQRIGDQRIDLVLQNSGETSSLSIAQVARSTGIRL